MNVTTGTEACRLGGAMSEDEMIGELVRRGYSVQGPARGSAHGPFDRDRFERCAHDQCPECHGTGRKHGGELCIHMLVCHCPKCSPRC